LLQDGLSVLGLGLGLGYTHTVNCQMQHTLVIAYFLHHKHCSVNLSQSVMGGYH